LPAANDSIGYFPLFFRKNPHISAGALVFVTFNTLDNGG